MKLHNNIRNWDKGRWDKWVKHWKHKLDKKVGKFNEKKV
jgi:hypothetical protein